MKKTIIKIILNWLPQAIIITILTGLVYGAVQQNYRQSANDPQIQIAEDIASILSTGVPLMSLNLPSGKADISKNLSTYIMVVDDKNKVLYSSAVLDNKTPSIPSGVLSYTKSHGENRLTWEPKKGVRSAIVVTYYKVKNNQSGYVIIGRSLREVEKRENQLLLISVLVGGFTLALTLVIQIFYLLNKKLRKLI